VDKPTNASVKNIKNIEELPLMMDAKDLMIVGFSRTMAYAMLNQEDMPVTMIGKRKFMKRDPFFDHLGYPRAKGAAA